MVRVKEFSEKGVSGFKVSAKDRDAIQEMQKDAALGKFDILLVFMFDRIGRKEDETPFVVEWFVRTKMRLGQIMQKGRFRGGVAPFGYTLEKQRHINKKNHEVYEIKVDENEAEVIKAIRGKSQFTPDLLNRLCAEAEAKTAATKADVFRFERELQNSRQLLEELDREYGAW